MAQRVVAAHTRLARGDRLRGLACAGLDRVAGRSLAAWMPRGAESRWLQRLQSEAQMLFYTHPVNDAREAARRLPINGVWFSAPGALDRQTVLRPAPVVVDTLRASALAGDPAAWKNALAGLDATLISDLRARAERGEAIALTLCGERAAVTLFNQPTGLAGRLARGLGLGRRAHARDLLDTL